MIPLFLPVITSEMLADLQAPALVVQAIALVPTVPVAWAAALLAVLFVTVVLVASVLANVRNSVALLFRELGTDNVFAYHRSGDPYAPASESEARRLPLRPEFAEVIAREGRHVRDVGVQLIVPRVVNGVAVVARAEQKPDRLSQWINRIRAERGFNKAAVALANKMARIGWAVVANNTVYRAA